jgi:hypothetical protein
MLLAALTTAATYLYTADTQETLKTPGLADLDRRATVHGWPWSYYAEVVELVDLGERQVAVMEYTEIRAEELLQTYALWFLVWLITVPLVLLSIGSRRKKDSATPRPHAPEAPD